MWRGFADMGVAPLVLSLGDFVRSLLLLLQQNGISLNLENERAWHELFYALKNAPAGHSGRPKALADLLFDWDGPYPKSQELSSSLGALKTFGLVCNSPRYTNYRIPRRLERLWAEHFDALPANVKGFLNIAYVSATERFQ
jgi:hypothetical protein